ncbi:YHS domain-containing (seleno)protein [Roseivirga echinicomitans]|uniref:YHS domain protein n=1 Tax=Roseivirga echinicomitans TaxID=296218 RepID=A0A150XUV6_9BACT|nr:YHS domain-containing (seleno)protein [Roseivirga echinicomitans]KYG82415.1 YHS domain protein [Roseivirga echinicomitans]
MKNSKYIILLVICIYATHALNAQDVKTKDYNLENGLAIQGYDPVAYFTENKAVEGTKNISSRHNGVTYYFANMKHKTMFDVDPSKYEPAYGGYCAYAMAFGDKVKIDPETFKIKNDRLFLFYNFRFNNTLKDWNQDEGNLFNKAESEWRKIISIK